MIEGALALKIPELADASRKLDKQTYKQMFSDLKLRVARAQRQALEAGLPVIIVFEGWHAAGKGSIINRLTQRIDPRGFKVHSINAPTEEERLRPWMWRFWRILPKRGNIAILDRSWYGRVLVGRMNKLVGKRDVEQAFEDIRSFEQQLTDDGTLVLKFWLHIDSKTQRKRFKKLEKDKATAWKVGKEEWKQNKRYNQWRDSVEHMLEMTSTPTAPWSIVEAADKRLVRVEVFKTIAQSIEEELARSSTRTKSKPMTLEPDHKQSDNSTIIDRLDLGLKLERETYKKELSELQSRIFRLEHEIYTARIPAVIVFEGVDAAGKGGGIRRLTRGLDPRGYEVVPTMAPSLAEKQRHYLWRFWKTLPKAGHITIFDRSWYGRVLVERVEGLCSANEWQRAFREINEFESQMTEFGTVVIKFWLQIDRNEQLRRFKARQETAHKQWKITDEDWRNRKKWPQYKTAVVDMLQKTSTPEAPWTILEANDKLYARVKALSTVAGALNNALQKQAG